MKLTLKEFFGSLASEIIVTPDDILVWDREYLRILQKNNSENWICLRPYYHDAKSGESITIDGKYGLVLFSNGKHWSFIVEFDGEQIEEGKKYRLGDYITFE